MKNLVSSFALFFAVTSAIAAPTVTSPPQSRFVRAGDKVAFAVGATGSSLTYKWSLNGTDITGATSSAYVVTNAQSAQVGVYSVLITDSTSATTNVSANLAVSAGLLHLFPTNLVVLRAGDGSAALANTGNSLFVDQITPGGAYVSTVTIPDSGSAPLLGYNALTDEYMSSSANNRAVLFGGFNVNKPFGSNLSATSASAAPRGIGTVNGLGYYSLAVSDTSSVFNSQFIKGATSTDGLTQFWTTGGSGIIYVAPSAGPDTVITSTAGRSSIGIYNSVLYNMPAGGLSQFGGLPTTATSASAVITGSANPNDFAISPDGLTIYTTDGSAVGSGVGGVRRYDNSGGTWSLTYTFSNITAAASGNNGPDGIAVDFSGFSGAGATGKGAVIYATSGQATANSVVRIVDNGVIYTPAPIIYTAGVNQVVRGIRFAPVADAPSIASQPASITNAPGATAIFTVRVTGSAPFSYQWTKNGTNLANAGNVSGVNSATLVLTNVSVGDSGNYAVSVSNDLNSATSSNAYLNVVFTPLAIVQQPQSVSSYYSGSASFSVIASGNPPFTYQWMKDGNNLADGASATGATISGSASNVLSIAGLAVGDDGAYSVLVTGSGTNQTSSSATLAVADPYVTSQPHSATNAVGGTAIFTVAGVGSPSLSYTWYKNGLASIYDDGRISGVDTDTLTIPNVNSGDAGYYTAYVTSGNGTTNSVDVTLTVLVPATITSPPNSQAVSVGDKVTFAVGAIGTSLSYQWSFNSTPIPGATASSYTFSNAQLTNAGSYGVQVSNVSSTNSASAFLTVVQGLLHLYPTNLVVLRAGDGSAPLASTGNSLYLDQITTNGQYVSTVTIPDSGANALIGNSALTDEYLSSAANNGAVLFGGFNTTKPYVSALASSLSASVPRGIGSVNGLGYYSLAMSDTNAFYSGQIVKAAASADGSFPFWTTGGNATAGIGYVPFVGGESKVANNNSRFSLGIFNNDLFACLSGGLFHFGGLPTNATTPAQLLASSNPDDFAISPDGNTIYLSDGSNLGTGGGGIQRWDYHTDTTNWVLSYTFNDMPGGNNANNGTYGVAVDFSQFTGGGATGTGAIVFATTGMASQNNVVRINDFGVTSTSTVIYSVGTNEVIRGIRFAPVALPVSIASQPQNKIAPTGSTVTFSVTAAGSAPFSYQWLKGVTPVTGATNSTLTLTNIQAGDAANYSVTITNDISLTNSATASLTIGTVQAPVISSIARSGPNINITWTNVINGINYRLQYNTNLATSNWISLTPDVTAANGSASKADTISGAQKFYRVMVP